VTLPSAKCETYIHRLSLNKFLFYKKKNLSLLNVCSIGTHYKTTKAANIITKNIKQEKFHQLIKSYPIGHGWPQHSSQVTCNSSMLLALLAHDAFNNVWVLRTKHFN
jgi:hypothetical protein